MHFLKITKLEFEVTGATNIDASVLINRIVSILKKSDYTVLSSTNNVVTFSEYDGNPWKIVSRGEHETHMDKGRFEISQVENENFILLSYYINPLTDIIFEILAILAGFIFNNLFFVANAIILIQFIARIYNIKKRARTMMYEIID